MEGLKKRLSKKDEFAKKAKAAERELDIATGLGVLNFSKRRET
jgi:hypothetical protein